MKFEYNAWKISTMVLLLIISLFAGTVGHMKLINFNISHAIYTALVLVVIMFIIQLPAFIEYVLKKNEVRDDRKD